MNAKPSPSNYKPSSGAKRSTKQLKLELDFMVRQNRNFRLSNNADLVEQTTQWPDGRIPNSIFFPESTVIGASDKPYSSTVDVFDKFCGKLEESMSAFRTSTYESMESGRSFQTSPNRSRQEGQDFNKERSHKNTEQLSDDKRIQAAKTVSESNGEGDSSTVDIFDKFCGNLEESMAASSKSRSKSIENDRAYGTSLSNSTKPGKQCNRNRTQKNSEELSDDTIKEATKTTAKRNSSGGFATMTNPELPMPKIVKRRSSSLLRKPKSNDKVQKTRNSLEKRPKSYDSFDSDMVEIPITRDDVRKSLEGSAKKKTDSFRSFRESTARTSRDESFSAGELKRKSSSKGQNSKTDGLQKKRNVRNEKDSSKQAASQERMKGMGKAIKIIIGRFKH